eukprot:11487996-Heterocapsa_arctica.AAC.1
MIVEEADEETGALAPASPFTRLDQELETNPFTSKSTGPAPTTLFLGEVPTAAPASLGLASSHSP